MSMKRNNEDKMLLVFQIATLLTVEYALLFMAFRIETLGDLVLVTTVLVPQAMFLFMMSMSPEDRRG